METVEKIQTVRSATSTRCTRIGSARPCFPIKTPEDRKPNWGEMTWQHRQWYSFVWICGDQIVEQHLHNIDVCNWVMGTHPVECRGQRRRGMASEDEPEFYGNIFDHIVGRFRLSRTACACQPLPPVPSGSTQNVSECIVGTKGKQGHDLGTRLRPGRSHRVQRPAQNPYVREHTAMMKASAATARTSITP